MTGPVFSPDQYIISDAPGEVVTIEFQSRTISPRFECQNSVGQRTASLTPIRFISVEELGFSLPFASPLRIEWSIPSLRR